MLALYTRRRIAAWMSFLFIAGFGVAADATTTEAQTTFNALAGNWSGGGQIKLQDGKSEKLSCRAYYNPKDGGNGLGLAIRCASASYKIELRSALKLNGNAISGSWKSGHSTPAAMSAVKRAAAT